MLTRRKARELAFILLFEECFNEDDVDGILEMAVEARDIETDEFSLRLFRETVERKIQLDAIIARLSKGRSVSRLSKVVLCCLRLALYEIDYMDDIDVSTSINEAVELAARYSDPDSGRFINGVLGSIARESAAPQAGAAVEAAPEEAALS